MDDTDFRFLTNKSYQKVQLLHGVFLIIVVIIIIYSQ